MGEGGEESGIIVGRWGGQLLWETYVPGVWYGAKVEYDPSKTQSSWHGFIIKKRKNLLICKKYICVLRYCSAILSRKKILKMSIRILPKYRCVSLVVLLQNGEIKKTPTRIRTITTLLSHIFSSDIVLSTVTLSH